MAALCLFQSPVVSSSASLAACNSSAFAESRSCRSKQTRRIRSVAVSCQAGAIDNQNSISRRHVAGAALLLAPFLAAGNALAILENDDDDELLEKVKRDRKAKIEKRSSLGQYKGQEAMVQKAVYKLSSVGKAIDEGDYAAATLVLGASMDTDWLKDLASATSTVSSSAAEKEAASTLTSSLASLQSAMLQDDGESAKKSFVVSAEALEKWSRLTGLFAELQGFE